MKARPVDLGSETVTSLAFEVRAMADREPEPNNPLGPFYPAELPDVPGDSRTWFALLLLFVILLGAVLNLFALLPF